MNDYACVLQGDERIVFSRKRGEEPETTLSDIGREEWERLPPATIVAIESLPYLTLGERLCVPSGVEGNVVNSTGVLAMEMNGECTRVRYKTRNSTYAVTYQGLNHLEFRERLQKKS